MFLPFLQTCSAQAYDLSPDFSRERTLLRKLEQRCSGETGNKDTKSHFITEYTEKVIPSSDGGADLELIFTRTLISSTVGKRSVEYDTAEKPRRLNMRERIGLMAIRPFFDPFIDKIFRVRINKKGEVTDVRIPPSFREDVEKAYRHAFPRGFASAYNTDGAVDTARFMIENYVTLAYSPLTEAPVGLQDTWTMTDRHSTNPGNHRQSAVSDMVVGLCRLESVENGVAGIKVFSQSDTKAEGLTYSADWHHVMIGEIDVDLESHQVVLMTGSVLGRYVMEQQLMSEGREQQSERRCKYRFATEILQRTAE